MRKHPWWRKLHWPEYGSELLGTAFLVFIALSAVTLNFGSDSPLAVALPNSSARRLITGLMLAGSGPLVAISPLGKLSGAHINPAISLAFWLQGKMHQHDLVGYIASQLFGAALGASLVVLIWRERAASVHNGITAPGVGYPLWSVFLLEMGLTSLLVLAIFLFVSSHRLMRWTPLMTWLLVALIYWQAAPISGSSLNPARSFGPALVSWFWSNQWIYYLAAPIGALLAVALFRSLSIVGISDVLTAKLFHAPRYRCIFKNVKAPQTNTDQEGKLVVPDGRNGSCGKSFFSGMLWCRDFWHGATCVLERIDMATSEDTVEIVRASADDLSALVPLFDGYRQFYGQTSNPEGARRFLAAHFEHDTSVIFLAFRRDSEGKRQACGFMQLYPSFSSVSMKRLWILNDLFVAPEARRLGVGRALLERAREFAVETGARGLTLNTAVDNYSAQALYEAAGWKRETQFYSYNLYF